MPTPGPAAEVNIGKEVIGTTLRAFVDTPVLHIDSGPSQMRSVTWTNGTGAPATLWFPNGAQLFSDGVDFSNPIDIPAGGLTLNFRPGLPAFDHHYHIYCEAVGDCAQGNSEPRVSCP